MTDFRFRLVDLIFNFKKLPNYDQDYLRTMTYETVKERSVNYSGQSFVKYYPNSNNFTLFNDQTMMLNYMTEFHGDYTNTASHLLHGKKYYFAWTHNKKK